MKNKHQIMNVHIKLDCLIPILSSLVKYYHGESETRGLASGTAKTWNCLQRDGNLSSLFQCGKKSSLVPKTFVEMIASAPGLANHPICASVLTYT